MYYIIHRSRYRAEGWEALPPLRIGGMEKGLPEAVQAAAEEIAARRGASRPDEDDYRDAIKAVYRQGSPGVLRHGDISVDRVEVVRPR